MAIFSTGQRTTNTSISAPCFEIRAAATNKPKLFEMGITQVSAPGAVAVLGLGRPAAIGVSPTINAFIDESDGAGPNPISTCAMAWGTAPTVPTNFFRRVSLNTATAVGVVWKFPRGLSFPVGTSLVLWAITAVVAVDLWALIEE